MTNDATPIEVGDRFESKDRRDGGRVVEVREARGLSPAGVRQIELFNARNKGNRNTSWGYSVDDARDHLRQRYTFFYVQTETHPNNPSAVGRHSQVHEMTLRTKYRRISR